MQFRKVNAIDFALFRTFFISLSCWAIAKYKELKFNEVPKKAWAWMILHAVAWVVNIVMINMALLTLSLATLFAVFDISLLAIWAWLTLR